MNMHRAGMFKSLLLAVGMVLGPVACVTVGPDYTPPVDTPPAGWHAQLPEGLTTGTLDSESLAAWWARFEDPDLTELIEQALVSNLDLMSAESRVRQARAQYGMTRSGLYPSLDLSGSYTHGKSSMHSGNAPTVETKTDLFRAGFDAGWEVDLCGGQRRSIEASERDREAVEAAYYDALVSLSAEVAVGYLDLRTYQNRLALAEENLRIQKETLDLVELRHRVGLSNELPVHQARYGYESTAAQLPKLQIMVNESMNRVAILVGKAPGSLHEQLGAHRAMPNLPATLAVGIPSEMLRRRPDIRQTERRIAAQTARIGVAVAQLYPKFYLNGSINRQGDGLGGVRSNPTEAWSLGPGVSWNLFKGWSIRQNIQLQTEVKEQYLLEYETVVLKALEEAENKLYAIGREQLREEKLASAVAAAQIASRLALEQYQAGLMDFSNVLSAEQSVVSLQDQLAESRGALATNLVSLFKALGGGWTPPEPGTTHNADS